MLRHLRAPVVGHRQPEEAVDLLELPFKALSDGCSALILHLAEHQKASLTLNQRANTGLIQLADDQVAFPVAWKFSTFDLSRSLMDRLMIRHLDRRAIRGAGVEPVDWNALRIRVLPNRRPAARAVVGEMNGQLDVPMSGYRPIFRWRGLEPNEKPT